MRSGTRQGCSLSSLFFNVILEFLANTIWQENKIKDTQIGKEDRKVLLFTDDIVVYVENPKEFLSDADINTISCSVISNDFLGIANHSNFPPIIYGFFNDFKIKAYFYFYLKICVYCIRY